MKRSLVFWVLALSLALGLGLRLASAALAQSGFELDWWVAAAGGGQAEGGGFELHATSGQPVVGASRGGAYGLSAGYWQMAEAAWQVFVPVVVH